MTAVSYTDAGTLAEYYWNLCVRFFVNHKKTLASLNNWIDTGQIILSESGSHLPLRSAPGTSARRYELYPRLFARLTIKIDGVPRDAADLRVLIPAVEPTTVETYPSPMRPPIFKEPAAELPPLTAPESTPVPAKRGLRGASLQQLVLDAAQWLAPQLRDDSKADDFRDACPKQFPGLSKSAYDKKVLPAARVLRGWPAKAARGAKAQSTPATKVRKRPR